MKAKDIRDYTDEQLDELLQEQQALLSNLKYNHALSPIENPARIRAIRKVVARVKTIQSQRKAAVTQA